MDENPGGRRWWQGATLYQLYVRSWRDTDGDGYGDLGGVIAGLGFAVELDFLKGRERFKEYDVFSLLHYNE